MTLVVLALYYSKSELHEQERAVPFSFLFPSSPPPLPLPLSLPLSASLFKGREASGLVCSLLSVTLTVLMSWAVETT